MNINAVAVHRAAAATIWLIAAMAVGTEIFAPLKSLLTSLMGQHWTTKSIVSLLAFALLYALFNRAARSDAVLSSAILLVSSAIASGLIIFAFFIWHFLYA